VLLFPEDPRECFEFTADALDLADRLQTPVFVMTDLDIGMNHRLCRPFNWDETRMIDRGKVMTAAELEAGKNFGRYLDVDGDGIPFRTYPGTHPTKGAFFTRGTTKDEYARYSEEGAVYVRNMERLQKKFHTAAKIAPQPVRYSSPKPTRYGVIYFGSTTPAMAEAIDQLEAAGNHVNALRVRAFPFAQAVEDFIHEHDRVFIVEQNRDGQLRTMLMSEFVLDGRKLVPVLHYDGTPITARFISAGIAKELGQLKVVSFEKAASRPLSPSPGCITPRWPGTRPATRGATTRAPYRRCAPAAATIRSAPRSSRRATNSTSCRTRSPSSRASAARPSRRPTSWAPATASTPCTAACRR